MTRRRVLFTFAGGRGHLEPMLPLARALRAAGHRVAVAGDEAVLRHVTGFDAMFPFETRLSTARSLGRLVRPDLQHEFAVIGRWFAGDLGRFGARLVADVIDAWQPDLVVHDEVDFGGSWAAERARLPRVRVLVIAAGGLIRPDVVRAPVASARAELGLPADPDLVALDGDLTVDPFPPSLRSPAVPSAADTVAVRPTRGSARPGAWSADGPRVYCTLGTVFNTESGDLFHRLLAALGSCKANAVVTIGHDLGVETFGAVPPGVRVERFAPQADLMHGCDLVVCHGGSGSTTTALVHGVPVLVLPMGADQELTAERVVALGVGDRLDAVGSSADDIAAAVRALLGSPAVSAAAQRVATEAAALPSVEEAVLRIEALPYHPGRRSRVPG